MRKVGLKYDLFRFRNPPKRKCRCLTDEQRDHAVVLDRTPETNLMPETFDEDTIRIVPLRFDAVFCAQTDPL